MGLAEIKAGLIKKGYSIESLKDKTEPKPKKAPKKENEPEVELKEHKCNECGETPKDCKCDDCDCDK